MPRRISFAFFPIGIKERVGELEVCPLRVLLNLYCPVRMTLSRPLIGERTDRVFELRPLKCKQFSKAGSFWSQLHKGEV